MSALVSVLPVPPHVSPAQDRRGGETLHLRAMRSEASDEDLMLRYGRGDARAFELLYLRHRLPLYRVPLRQVGNTAAAAGVVPALGMRVVNFPRRSEADAR